MTIVDRAAAPQRGRQGGPGKNYKWIALSNTTLGLLMATINSSIVLIALPDIFRGIGINPLAPGNTSYLLWMIMGFLVVTAVLVVGFGRLGDMYGRVKMYNLGFVIFTIASVLLALTWQTGPAAAWWLIGWRIVQGVGGAFLMANSSAILTDAFPVRQRGTALGINGVAAIAGSFLGLVIGGLLGPVDWKLIFLVSVPFGVFGTVWAYLKLHDTGERRPAKMDWWGNLTFAVGLIALLVGITYGIQPYGDSVMGWGSPLVLTCVIGGIAVLVLFGFIETRVANPLFTLSLFRIRRYTLGNLANLLASLGRGGLQFILIIWLQGIWLPQHGYSFSETPLWAGIYMLPLTVGFLVSAPLSGILSDRFGARWFSTGGMVLTAVTFGLLLALPINFGYWAFATVLLFNGIGMGLFSSPNRAEVMNSLPADARGAGAGMNATFQNSAMVLSIGFFFSLMIAGLSRNLPSVMEQGLLAHGVPAQAAAGVAHLPPVGVLFAAFLGYNPIQELLGPVLPSLPADQATFLTGRSFFPQLISGPFADGLAEAFWFAIIACVVAAVASWLCGGPLRRSGAAAGAVTQQPSVGGELAAVAAEAGTAPTELVGGERRNGVGHTAVAISPGLRPDVTAIVLNGRGAAHDFAHDFALDGHAGVHGQVDDGRAPLPDAVVLATDATGRVVGRTVTDAAGAFTLAGLPLGPGTVTASRHGHWPAAVGVTVAPDGGAALRLTVPPARAELAGTVAGPDGTPLAGATVTAGDTRGEIVASTTSGPDGSYRFADLTPGRYTVVATLHAPAAVQVELPARDAARVDLHLGAPAREHRPAHAAQE